MNRNEEANEIGPMPGEGEFGEEAASPDQHRFVLDAVQWAAFVAALDAPPRRHERLTRLFREPSVLDNGL